MGAVYNSSYFQEGVYFQDQMKWKGLSILSGGREDWVNYQLGANESYGNENARNIKTLTGSKPWASQSQYAFTLRSGLIYQFKFGLSPYFSYSTSFIPQAGSRNYLLQPFSPLTGKELEAGFKYKVPNNDIIITSAVGSVKSQGFELAANANVTKNLRVIASYSYTDIRFAKSNLTAVRYDPVTSETYGKAISQEGMTLPYVPRNMFSFFSDYMLPNNFIRGWHR